MSEDVKLIPPLGLVTEPAAVAAAPQGSLSQADNVVFRRPGMAEPRPGFEKISVASTSPRTVRSIAELGDSLLFTYSDPDTLEAGTYARWWAGSSFTNVAVIINALAYDGALIEHVKAKNALYAMTWLGVRTLRQEGNTAYTNAGAPPPRVYSCQGTGSYLTRVAATIEYRLENGTLESSPTIPLIHSKSTSTSPVSLSVLLPAFLPVNTMEGHTLNLYRSDVVFGAEQTPPAELYLCAQKELSSADFSNHNVVTIIADLSNPRLGRALYTNASQEGAEQTNLLPPGGTGMAEFAESLFVANAVPVPTVEARFNPARLVGDDPPPGTATFTTGSATVNVTGLNTTYAGDLVGKYIRGSGSYATYYEITSVSVNSSTDADYTITPVSAETSSTTAVFTPAMDVEVTYMDDSTQSYSFPLGDTPSADIWTTNWTSDVMATLNRAFAENSVPLVAEAYLDTDAAPPTSNPGGGYPLYIYAIRSGIKSFTITYDHADEDDAASVSYPDDERGVFASTASSNVAIYDEYYDQSSLTAVLYTRKSASSQPYLPGILAYSKERQPEAFPPGNYIGVGEAGTRIIGLIPTRDALWVFKEEGIYKLTGTPTLGFRVVQISNARLIHHKALTAYQDSCYAWTDQGVGRVTDYGFESLSQGVIGDQLEPYERLYLTDRGYSNDSNSTRPPCLGAHPEHHELYVSCNDGNYVYVYNFRTKAWSRWTDRHRYACMHYSPKYRFLFGGADADVASNADPIVYQEKDWTTETYPALGWGTTSDLADTREGYLFEYSSGEYWIWNETAGAVYGGTPTGSLDEIYDNPMCEIAYNDVHLNEPTVYKTAKDGRIILQSPESVLFREVTFTSDDGATSYVGLQKIEQTPDTAVSPSVNRFWVPRQVANSYALRPKVRLAGRGKNFQFAGITINYTNLLPGYARS